MSVTLAPSRRRRTLGVWTRLGLFQRDSSVLCAIYNRKTQFLAHNARTPWSVLRYRTEGDTGLVIVTKLTDLWGALPHQGNSWQFLPMTLHLGINILTCLLSKQPGARHEASCLGNDNFLKGEQRTSEGLHLRGRASFWPRNHSVQWVELGDEAQPSPGVSLTPTKAGVLPTPDNSRPLLRHN